MDTQKIMLLSLLPIIVAISFLVHWLTIRHIEKPEERLPFCRGAYLAMSFQLVLFSWIVFTAFREGMGLFFLMPLGMTLSFAGDFFNLQFPSVKKKTGEPVFWGIVCFALAQVCYIAAFLSMLPMGDLRSNGYLVPILAALILVPAITFRLRVYNPARPKSIMRGAFLYGFILGAMAAITFSAALARGGYWYITAAGAAFFLLSDAVMGETTIHGRHPRFEYQVPWLTYIIAQGLILFGTAAMMI